MCKPCVNQQKLGAGPFNNLRFRTVCENVFREKHELQKRGNIKILGAMQYTALL